MANNKKLGKNCDYDDIIVKESKETESVGKRKKENRHQYSRYIDRPTIGQNMSH